MHDVIRDLATAYCRYLDLVGRADAVCGQRVLGLAEWCGVTPGRVGILDRLASASGVDGSYVVRGCVAEDGGSGGSQRVVVGAGAGDAVDGCVVGGAVCDVVGDEASVVGGVAVSGELLGPRGGVSIGRGPNYERNQRKRAERKARAAVPEWRRKSSPPPSLSPTVETVTTGVAEEMEARRTLALRRSAENKVAAALAEHRLRSLADKDKTAALARLDAARVEQRINDAKAKSQASYKKCDESLGSLGSTGSAGEFALKKEVQAAKDEALAMKRQRDYYEKQLSVSFSYISPEGMRAVAELPEPVYDDDRVDDCGLDELPEDMPVNDKVAYLTRMGCQDAAEALLFETYGF